MSTYREIKSVRNDIEATVMCSNGWEMYSVGYDSEGNPTYTLVRENDGEGHYEEGDN